MWLNSTKDLAIYKTRYADILSRNTSDDLSDLEEVQEQKFALNHGESEEFVNINCLNLVKLKIQGDLTEENVQMEYLEFNIKTFINLKILIYNQMSVSNEDLQVIGENCPQLKSLHLIKCFCQHFETLTPGVNLNIDHICHMTQLEELKIEAEKPLEIVKELQLKYVQLLLNSLKKLKNLDLTNFTIVCEDPEKTDKTFLADHVWNVEVLNLGFITYEFWCTFSGFLKCCPHLKELTILASDQNIIVNAKVMDILSKSCKNLKALTLENCEINAQDFQLLKDLQNLSLISCREVTFINLQQILGGLKLKTFKLVNTPIQHIINYIYITPTLESIFIDTLQFQDISKIFQNSLNNFDGLHTLDWQRGALHCNWLPRKCPHLQKLQIANCFQLPRMIFHIKSLQDLTLSSCNNISWSLLWRLFHNLPLKRLNILNCKVISDIRGITEGCFRTQSNLEFLSLPFELFQMGISHCLNLLEANESLKILIYGNAEEILNFRFLCLLMTEECVRKRSKQIKICGFNLELDNFQYNTILREFVYLQINTNYFKSRNKTFTLEL